MRVFDRDLQNLQTKKTLILNDTKRIYYGSQTNDKISLPDEITIKLGTKEIILPQITWDFDGDKISMRYGTNPTQSAKLYGNRNSWNFVKMGKNGPSATNIQDINQGIEIIKFFDDNRPASVVMKHLIPSGFSVGNNGESQTEVYERSRDLDYFSSFGGVVILNQPLNYETAEKIVETFIELVAAPKIDREVIEFFNSNPKKKSLRLVEIGDLQQIPKYLEDASNGIEQYYSLMSLYDGSLILERPYLSPVKSISDLIFQAYIEDINQYVKYKPEYTETLQDLLDSWHVLESVRSNASVIMKDGRAVNGSGETKRINSVENAKRKAQDYINLISSNKNHQDNSFTWKGAVGATDGFLPFDDSIKMFSSIGVDHIIFPPGGNNLGQVISTANELEISITFVQENARCFTHK
jgi:phosphoribosylaminoimidazolecarboxamide formyltransferase/IMP cyclohydrolase